MAEFLLTFDNSQNGKNPEPARATARIRLDKTNRGMVEFEVDMNEVPVYHNTQGKDVVVDWSFSDVDFGN